jgi:hypothetical protein
LTPYGPEYIIETHKEELQLTTLNYESPVGIGLKNE